MVAVDTFDDGVEEVDDHGDKVSTVIGQRSVEEAVDEEMEDGWLETS